MRREQEAEGGNVKKNTTVAWRFPRSLDVARPRRLRGVAAGAVAIDYLKRSAACPGKLRHLHATAVAATSPASRGDSSPVGHPPEGPPAGG